MVIGVIINLDQGIVLIVGNPGILPETVKNVGGVLNLAAEIEGVEETIGMIVEVEVGIEIEIIIIKGIEIEGGTEVQMMRAVPAEIEIGKKIIGIKVKIPAKAKDSKERTQKLIKRRIEAKAMKVLSRPREKGVRVAKAPNK